MVEAKKLRFSALVTLGLCAAALTVGGALLRRTEPVLIEKRAVGVSASSLGKQGSAAYGAKLSPDDARASFGLPASREE